MKTRFDVVVSARERRPSRSLKQLTLRNAAENFIAGRRRLARSHCSVSGVRWRC